jgi:alkylhydroperoxidase/carboxymuconolactone decarboxylase family protein YurZ
MPSTSQELRRADVKAAYEDSCGRWPEQYDAVLEADPEFMEAFRRLAALPAAGGHLEPKVRELLGVAASASVAHLHAPAVQMHVRTALAHGASVEEVLAVLECASVLGIHTCTMAVPLLVDEDGREDPRRELTEREDAVRERFQQGRGFWPEPFEDMVRLDAGFVDAYRDYSSVPRRKGHLDAKLRELVYIAIDANATHLYEFGTRMHIQNALRAGATPAEILDVLRLAVQVGFHSCTMALPLLEELTAA